MDIDKKDELGALLGQLIRAHHYRMHIALGKLGLYPGQPHILFLLREKNGRSQAELAEKIGLRAATVTIVIKRMEKAGLVERRADPEDLRISRVFLTEQGKSLCQRSKEVVSLLEEECFKNFTTEERVLLRRFLIQMRGNLVEAKKPD